MPQKSYIERFDNPIVVMGASLGGLRAYRLLLGMLKRIRYHIAIVQHRMSTADDQLEKALQSHTALPVSDVTDKAPIEPGRVYVAPADYHLLVEGDHFALSTEAPVCQARPSVDVLFESAAISRGSDVVAVVMSGGNHDGARGARIVKERGGYVIVQEPTDAECAVMPQAASMHADEVVPLQTIAERLMILGTARQGAT